MSAFGMRRQVYVAQEHGQPESTRGKVYFLVSGSAVTPGGAWHRYLLLSALLSSLFDLSRLEVDLNPRLTALSIPLLIS